MHPAGGTIKHLSAGQQFNTYPSSSNQWWWKGNGDGLSACPDAGHTEDSRNCALLENLWFLLNAQATLLVKKN